MKQQNSLKRKTPLKTNTPLKRKTPLQSRSKKSKEKSKFEISEISRLLKPLENKKKHIEELDTVFQFYVRLRDAMPGGMTKCISCGRILSFDKMQGGHYCSRRHFSTRWNEDNVHSECFSCNCMDGDHLIQYRKNLIRKIGEKKVEWIEAYCKETRKWSDFELVLLIKEYSKRRKESHSARQYNVSSKNISNEKLLF